MMALALLPPLFRFRPRGKITEPPYAGGGFVVVDVALAAEEGLRIGHWYYVRLKDGRQFFRRVLAGAEADRLILATGDPSKTNLTVNVDDIDTLARPVAIWWPVKG